MSANTESPGARILAGSLRQAREASGMSLRVLGKRIGVSYSVISYWETAQRVPSPEDVASFLTAVGVTGEKRSEIVQIAKDAAIPDYLTVNVGGNSRGLNGVMECERAANAITDWSPMLVPGLLQTAEYARAILGDDAEPRQQVEHRVTLRVGRLNTVLQRAAPAAVNVLIGEFALRYQIGGTEVMVRQLRTLVKTAKRHGVAVRVVPASGGWHPGLMGPFVLYEFPTAPAIVHLEHYRSGAFLIDRDAIADYKIAVDMLHKVAMDREQSAGLIAKIADETESVR